uniref:Uncharacterized protein n=1 Tax=Trypanosoma vivax (strain Y486) TaxID=1055687 RepID=G0UAQ0_TRYVY|nr:hypothetical protein, conserved in T. vivax [Trypanosoma vivax Y486]
MLLHADLSFVCVLSHIILPFGLHSGFFVCALHFMTRMAVYGFCPRMQFKFSYALPVRTVVKIVYDVVFCFIFLFSLIFCSFTREILNITTYSLGVEKTSIVSLFSVQPHCGSSFELRGFSPNTYVLRMFLVHIKTAVPFPPQMVLYKSYTFIFISVSTASLNVFSFHSYPVFNFNKEVKNTNCILTVHFYSIPVNPSVFFFFFFFKKKSLYFSCIRLHFLHFVYEIYLFRLDDFMFYSRQ